MKAENGSRYVMGIWSKTVYGQFPEKILFLQREKEVHLGGFWLKALMAMIVGRALCPGSSHSGAGEQSTQDHDRAYDKGYHDGHEDGFHKHDDLEFLDDDFF